MDLKTIAELPIEGRRVFFRVDLNVPVSERGEIIDDTRIRAVLRTISHGVQRKARLVLASHLGRPQGKATPKLSLRPVAARLGELLRQEVLMAPDCTGKEVRELARNLPEGGILLLENLRFHPEEESNDPAFSQELASLAEAYINDAFGSSHRSHASVVGMVRHMTVKGVGFLMQDEIKALSHLLASPEKPFVAILGGAKVSDKIGVIRNLLPRTDSLLIGGAMAYTFLKAQGRETGRSLLEQRAAEKVEEILQEAAARGVRILLPEDHIVAREIQAGIAAQPTFGPDIPADMIGVDLGPRSISRFAEMIGRARTIFWNGPMGVFEVPSFDTGTLAIARAVAESGAFSVAGGGDTVAALTRAGLSQRISHLSTGGGASLEFLQAGDLPGLKALRGEDG